MNLTISEALFQAASAYRSGDLPVAESLFRAVLSAQPLHAEANHGLGLIASALRKYRASLPFFKAALEADPRQLLFWLSYIDNLLKDMQIASARNVLRQGRDLGLLGSPADELEQRILLAERFSARDKLTPAYIRDILLLRDAGDFSGARDALNLQIGSNYHDGYAWALLAHILLLSGKLQEAQGAFETASAISPELPCVLRVKARLLLRQGKSIDALGAAHAAYQRSTDDLESWLVFATALFANEKIPEALALIEPMLGIRPEYPEALALRSHIRAHVGDISGAIADAELALTIKPHLSQFAVFLARLYYKNKNTFRAVEVMKTACQLDPSSVSYAIYLGEFLRQDGRLNEALKVLESVALKFPGDSEVWLNLGMVLQGMGRDSDARVAYEKALAINPSSAEISNNIGILAYNMEDWHGAISYFDKAIAAKPLLGRAHANRGAALKELGLLDDAVKSCKKALEVEPGNLSDVATYLNLARVLKLQGKAEEAAGILVMFSELDSESPAMLFNNAEDAYFEDKLAKAREAYEKVQISDPGNLGLMTAVGLAALDYIAGDLEGSRKRLQFSSAINEKSSREFQGWRAYWIYLTLLLEWRSANSFDEVTEAKILYVVGESHCIATNGVVADLYGGKARCEAKWIRGCKQWHLGRGNVQIYRNKFESIVLQLPSNSYILLLIGEIDCRHDEGILQYIKNHPEEKIEDVVAVTVREYLRYVTELAEPLGHRLILQNIPCPNVKPPKISAPELGSLIELIILFNRVLETEALFFGIDVLDVHTLTNDGVGISNKVWHLDAYHLLPSATVEAFRRCFLLCQ